MSNSISIMNDLNTLTPEDVRALVRESYGRIASGSSVSSCCGPSCCGGSIGSPLDKLGYSEQETSSVPDGANLGLGCGNPVAIASLKAGEVVVDLGSGAGFDCFLAAQKVGPTGRVIGIDMTAEMLARARKNAAKGGYTNVEFRLGEIEHLPVADNSVDTIISNCVINLSPDKRNVIRESFRVLRPNGRLAISDIVAFEPLPDAIRNDLSLLCGCMSGASAIAELRQYLADAGFVRIAITENIGSREFIRDWAPDRGIEKFVTSASIEARKP
jgi:SAM-dependent methyltransferase